MTTHDGVALDGWVATPAVPRGVRTPTVLIATPYLDSFTLPGSLYHDPESASWWNDENPGADGVELTGDISPIKYIRAGYTLAFFSVRGTGNSGGCFQLGGADEQRDEADLVNWIAAQPWSNARVGMIGLSYMSYTSWQAATQAPPALKAIITAGDLIDQYQFAYSPQGARSAFNDAYLAAYSGVLTAASGYASTNTAHLARTGCNQGIADIQGVLSGLATGDRNAAFWEERSLSRKLPAVRSAVLDAPGFFDEGPHQYQDATIWGSIPASTPKVQVRGWWGHDFPNEYSAWATRFDFPSGTTTWEKLTFGWFDYWLKGIGPEPRTDVVYHQDQDLHWREARGWSPSANTKETLFLDGDALAPVPRAGTTTFVSAFQPADEFFDLDALAELVSPGAIPDDAGLEYGLCPDQKRLGVARAYVSAPVKATTQIAGNPFADLTVSDDQAGGQITATMFDLAPDSSCVGPYVQGARWIAAGAADLNFYNSPYRATPFPIGTPTEVRIDLTDTSYTLHAGHRLALLLNYGEIGQATPGTAPASTITVHGARPDVNAARASHLVVPVDGGTFGGSSPTLTYPPRPFTPPGYRD